MRPDLPKMLRNPEVKAARLLQLHEDHMAPLTRFVEELRVSAGTGAAIPYFDPWDGGVEADVLFLLEAPGPKAVGSSFISRNNPDETAKNFFNLTNEAGLQRKKSVVWNAVPWYIGSGTKIRAANPKDLEAGLRPLPMLLDLLPHLKAIVFMGQKAQKARSQVELLRPDLALFSCPHPSPMFINRLPGNRARAKEALQIVSSYLTE
ncbi:uracil-DNA glycosylase [Pseudomonas fluorescens]|uniref:uracil-DNA glycosylase n=1 Tax=Pseudomonas fluorescens TaxID=294 RepID=UPI003CFEEFBE